MHTILDTVISNNNPCDYFSTRCSRLFFPKTSRLKIPNSAVIWLPGSHGTSQSSPNTAALVRPFCPATDFEFGYILLRTRFRSSRQTECSSWAYTRSICTSFPRPRAILEQTSPQNGLYIPSGFGLNQSVSSFATLAISSQLPTQLHMMSEEKQVLVFTGSTASKRSMKLHKGFSLLQKWIMSKMSCSTEGIALDSVD